MAKLERKNFKVFAENAPLEEMGQFGSAVATTKKNTKDIEEIQELEAWKQGWGGAVISNKNYPPMEEMNGALNVMSYQTAYTLQEGIPEWNKDTVYYIGSIVKTLVDNKVVLYQSLKNDNIGNVLDNSEYWEKLSFGGSGLEICDIGMALYIDETKGLRRYLNGQVVDINTNTQAFLNRLKDITTLHPSLLCTEEEWQTAKTMSAFGQVGKFVFNYNGADIVSVRIPRVVNVQGLFDLQNLGMTVSAGLPNITGAFDRPNRNGAGAATGAFSNGASVGGYARDGVVDSSLVNFDASNSNSIYGNSDTVQPEAIQYPYFIQIATGSETENNIINEIELNNPYSLFDSKYSDHELNNLSWLKSEGQWNAKAVYPTAYDKLLKVYNGTETVVGLSVKLSTETYTDYDFVLNTADETFRLPITTINRVLVAKKEATSEDLSWYNWYSDGWLEIGGSVESTTSIAVTIPISFLSTDYYAISTVEGTTQSYTCSVFKDSPSTFRILAGTTNSCTKIWQACGYAEVPTENNNLYFYVGETVQNANLIDAGRLGEQLANKVDISNTQWATSACMPDYSAGIEIVASNTEQYYTCPSDGFVIFSGGAFDRQYSYLKVNDVVINNASTTGNTYITNVFACALVSKNDVCKFRDSYNNAIFGHFFKFFPLKGAN